MSVIDLKSRKPKAAKGAQAQPNAADVVADVSADLFWRASRIVGDRFYGRDSLAGVCLEPCAAGGVFVVATDGARLLVLRDPSGSVSGRVHVRCALPEQRELRAVLDSHDDSEGVDPARLRLGGGRMWVESQVLDRLFGGTRVVVEKWQVGEPFVDWRRQCEGEAVDLAPDHPFDPRLLKRLARLLHSGPGRKCVAVRQFRVARAGFVAEACPLLVTSGGGSEIEGFALVMPVRAPPGGVVAPALPEWLRA